MEETFFAEAFEVGYYLFTNTDSEDLTVASQGIYYLDNNKIEVDTSGKIIRKKNNLTKELVIYKDSSHEFFGGDTFINRFSVKRKHSFFTNNSYQLPDNTPINYSLYPNIGYPIYFFNTQENSEKDIYYQFTDTLGSPLNLSLINKKIKNLGESYDNLLNIIKGQLLNPYNYLKPPNYNVDCNSITDNSLFNLNSLTGVIYTYYYGIPYFLVESDINLDLRDSGTKESQFYPKNNNLQEYLQDDYLHNSSEDVYSYDKSFSKQSTEKKSLVSDPLFKGDLNHLTNKEQRIIYSPESGELEENNEFDRYLQHKPIDYYDFSYSNGKLTGVESLENNVLLARFSKGLRVFNATVDIETNLGQVNLSAGTLFKGKPQEFLNVATGFVGSDLNCFLSTPYGHVVVDPERGQVFMLGRSGEKLDDLSNKQLTTWFKENLPFRLKRYIPDIELNSSNHIGISLGFDQKFSVIYLTKIDYQPLIAFDFRKNKFYIKDSNIEIFLNDKRYFRNLSWNVSYSFKKQEWISFHSFIPNLFFNYKDHFDTFIKGKTKSSMWKHNTSNKSYLTYYGQVHPFILDVQQSGKYQNEIIKHLDYYVDTLKYYNDFDYKHLNHHAFNEVVIYNENQNSGYSKQFPVNPLNNRNLVSVRQKENKFSINQFKDISKLGGLNWIIDPNNVLKKLNDKNLDYLDNSTKMSYIRGLINNVRFVSYETDFKIIFKGLYLNGKLSSR
jgi:hypothetical protein